MKDIEVWFHCWCGNSNFHVPASRILKCINDKISKLQKSGLYNKMTTMFLVAHGISEKNKFIFEDIKESYSKIKILEIPVGKIGHESDTLNLMMERYKKNDIDVNVLFFHTKGFSYPDNIPFIKKIDKWVRYMDLFLIHDWKKNQEILNTYDTSGMFLFEPDEESRKQGEPNNRKTYAGWFWWSKSEYIRELNYLSHKMDKGKGGEFWLLDKDDVKYYVIPTDHFWPKHLDLHKHEVEDKHIFPEGW